MLAQFSVLSRLVAPENSSIYSKMRVYDGENLKDTDPKAKSVQEYRDYAGVDEGTACTQSSFKVGGKKAFLYIGAQGGRYKAMFKLVVSLEQAKSLAKREPERFELGVGNWVTTRFSAEDPLPKKIWNRWLKESYAGATKSPAAKKKTAKKKTAKKKTAKKKKG